VATKIKLMRLGKMRAPYYRIVVADARTKRDGRSIETIGKYHPKEDPSFIEVDSERAQYWLSVGAQPTDAVAAILRVTGDWQKFKGEPAPPPMKVAEPKADKKVAFEAASLANTEGGAATTPKKKAAVGKKADDDTAPAGHAAPPADQPATATPASAEGAGADSGPSTAAETAASSPEGDSAPDPDAGQQAAAEAGTGFPREPGGAADASAAATAADDATSGS